MEKEAGWEFTLPRYVSDPFNWLLAILIIIALVLFFVLVTKIISKQSGNQPITILSP